jgi:hypothetical protein
VLVHVTLALFVIGGNSIPSVLKIQLALWPSQWFSGGTAVVLPLALCVLVSYLTFMRLFTLYQEGVTKGVEKEGIKHPEAEKTAPDPD